MSDRLKELQRQRALIQEQMAWIDGEIARETVARPATPVSAAETPAPPEASAVAGSADELLSHYRRQDAGGMAKDARRGCLFGFAMLMAALVLLVTAAYFFYTRARG